MRGASGAVRNEDGEERLAAAQLFYARPAAILTTTSRAYVRSADLARMHNCPRHTEAQPLGGNSLTSEPRADRDKVLIEPDSHMNSSRNFRPFSDSG